MDTAAKGRDVKAGQLSNRRSSAAAHMPGQIRSKPFYEFVKRSFDLAVFVVRLLVPALPGRLTSPDLCQL